MSRSLARATRLTRTLARRTQAQPIRWMRWLPVQDRYLRNRASRRLLRAGNQSVGKTTVALADVVMEATGTHPYRPPQPLGPGVKQREFWVICASWSQSKAAQKKLFSLIPRDRLHPDTVFTAIRGFKGREPAVELRHEDGTYSLIRIKTTRQGTLDLSSATIQGALFDEVPASKEVYSEICMRVQSTGGWVAIAATMVGAPVEWVREEVKEGRLADIHTPLTPQALIPIGSRHPRRTAKGRPMDADWIAAIEQRTPPHERDVRIHGGWEIRVTDRYFDIFVSDPSVEGSHVTTRPPQGRAELLLGIDHGSKPGKQIALLVAVTWPDGPAGYPAVHVLDEYVDQTGVALPADDAKGILAMLERHNLRWGSLDFVCGDRVHMPGSGQQKSNRDLQVALARELKVAPRALRPEIKTAKRGKDQGRGSVDIGSRWLYHAMVHPGGFSVHPRCERLIQALDRYTMADDDYKDPVDALRYALKRLIFRTHRVYLAAA